MRKLTIALFGAALLAGSASLAAAQSWSYYHDDDRYRDRDHDRDRDRNYRDDDDRGWDRNGRNNSAAWQAGYREGFSDARNGRRRRADDHDYRGQDRAAYVQGYKRGWEEGNRRGYGNWGYGNGGYGNGGYGNGGYGRNGGYGGYGNGSIVSTARQYGYQDGLHDGEKDRQTGHSFRPTEHDTWKDADHGQSTVGGDKQIYKNAYREAYNQGYRQGYGNGIYRR
ncbi:MAG TPA: hypothetical protein VFA60_11805 [Terriglobales bacterium]|nr:hypothetical protein [Terriglobales bacterium]